MGEFELIRHYFAAAACARAGGEVVLGIGDDCALLQIPSGEQLAVSTDTLVAGVHFPDPCDPFLLGQRALAVAASDLAGMGATPIGFTLALSLPSGDPLWLAEFARGLDAMALDCSLRLIGGDTTRGPLSLTVTVFGRVPSGQALVRSGAQVGDLLCVGGVLGEAAGALPLVLRQAEADADVAEHLLARYWSPQPQLALVRAAAPFRRRRRSAALRAGWRRRLPAGLHPAACRAGAAAGCRLAGAGHRPGDGRGGCSADRCSGQRSARLRARLQPFQCVSAAARAAACLRPDKERCFD